MKTKEEVVKFISRMPIHNQASRDRIIGYLVAKYGLNDWEYKTSLASMDAVECVDFNRFLGWFNSPDENDPTSDNYVDWKAKGMSGEVAEETHVDIAEAYAKLLKEIGDMLNPEEEIGFELDEQSVKDLLFDVVHNTKHVGMDYWMGSLKRPNENDSDVELRRFCVQLTGGQLSEADKVFHYVKSGIWGTPAQIKQRQNCSCKKGDSCEK